MAFDNTVTVVGNITRDPELRFTPGGAPVASFGLAWNRRDQNGEDVTSFFDVTCWRDLAENVAESLSKGARVVVYGRLDLCTTARHRNQQQRPHGRHAQYISHLSRQRHRAPLSAHNSAAPSMSRPVSPSPCRPIPSATP